MIARMADALYLAFQSMTGTTTTNGNAVTFQQLAQAAMGVRDEQMASLTAQVAALQHELAEARAAALAALTPSSRTEIAGELMAGGKQYGYRYYDSTDRVVGPIPRAQVLTRMRSDRGVIPVERPDTVGAWGPWTDSDELLQAVLRDAEYGHPTTVTNNGKPIAKVVHPDADTTPAPDVWQAAQEAYDALNACDLSDDSRRILTILGMLLRSYYGFGETT